MRAIILAAGRGSRMGALTREQPKCLTELLGQPLLDWQIGALRRAGVERVAIVRGYKAELLERPGAAYFGNPRWSETNMVMSLACADAWLREDGCIVSYSDIAYPSGAVRALAESAGDIAITYDVNWLELWRRRFANPLDDAESFKVSPDGTLLDIGRRVSSLDEVRGQYMGLLRFSPAGWASVARELAALAQEERDRLDMTSLLRRLLAAGVAIRAVPLSLPWFEVDSPADLELYTQMLGDPQLARALRA
jgi:choline kinase